MTFTPLGQRLTHSGDLITEADDPPFFPLQSSGSESELWCGLVVPSPPCSPILKSVTSKIDAVGYGQAKSRSAGWSSSNIEASDKLGKASKASDSSARGSSRASDTLMPPFDRNSFSPPRRPKTTDLPLAPTSSLPDIQPRPSSAPACGSADASPPVEAFSTSITSHVPLKEGVPTGRSNAISMSGIMALGTRQTIASPNIMQTPFRQHMPPVGMQANGGYPSLPISSIMPPNTFSMVNFQTTPTAQGGFPIFMPQPPAIVPPPVPGFPPFPPTPINSSWGIPGQNVMPYPNIAYPNIQQHVSPSSFNKTSYFFHGKTVSTASASNLKNEDVLSQRQFIIQDPTAFSTRGKRRRTSISTASSSDSSDYNRSTSSIASTASTAATSEGSFCEPPQPHTFICKLNGCNARLQNVDKRSFNHHLILEHSFHGSGKRELIRCQWRDDDAEGLGGSEGKGKSKAEKRQEGVVVCGKLLQMQSLVKHVCEKHFDSLGKSCSLCGSRQARADNMVRHLMACKPFAGIGREMQRRIWEELVPNKSFDDVYLGGRGVKRRKVVVDEE